mgnify:CR=1 FL=1
MRHLFSELKRRKVLRAAGAYLVVAWITLQVAAILLPAFEVPNWGMRLVFFMCALGLPLVVLLAWAYELSPGGMRRTPEQPEEDEASADPGQARGRNWAAFALGAAVPTVGFALLFLVFLFLGPGAGEPEAESGRTIAVLPFTNLSANADNEYFTAGMHEDLITQLARIDDLAVASKNSVLRFKQDSGDLRKVADELAVHYIVEGSVQRNDEDLRVTVQLVDAETEKNLWAQTFDRRIENLFALQSEISREIAQRVQARITPEEEAILDRVPTRVVAAYDAYLKARNGIAGFWVGFDVLAEAEKNLDFATRADPEFVEAWALRSVIHSRRYMQLFSFDQANPAVQVEADAALADLDQARDLGPGNVATLRAEGFYSFVVTNDFLEGSRSLDKALALVPNDTETLTMLAFCYRRLGRIDKAIEILQAIYKQNPDAPFVFNYLTSNLHDTAQYSKLIPIYERALEKFPERKHYLLNKLYYEFLVSGSLDAFKAYEKALKETEITEGCDPATWRNGRMTVAMLNGEFDAYARDWHTKWEAHHRGHGDWVCPLQVNEEANQAALLILNGKDEEAHEIIEKCFQNIDLPPNPLAACTFDTEMIRPKLYYMDDDPEKAREELRLAMNKLGSKPDSLLKYVEKAVLLEAADLVSPKLAYSIFKDIQSDPIRMVTLETVCASPWTYPRLMDNPDFQEDIRADGRFVTFLEHYGFLVSTRPSAAGS